MILNPFWICDSMHMSQWVCMHLSYAGIGLCCSGQVMWSLILGGTLIDTIFILWHHMFVAFYNEHFRKLLNIKYLIILLLACINNDYYKDKYIYKHYDLYIYPEESQEMEYDMHIKCIKWWEFLAV